MPNHNDYTLSFGKHKGIPLIDVPVSYLDWLLGQDWLRPEQRAVIKEHLETSRKAEWEALSED